MSMVTDRELLERILDNIECLLAEMRELKSKPDPRMSNVAVMADERWTPGYAALSQIGVRKQQQDWPEWKALIERYTPEEVGRVAMTLPIARRYANIVAAELAKGQSPNGHKW